MSMTVRTPALALLQQADHGDLRDSVRRFLEKRCDEAAIRKAMDSELGHDPSTWRQLAEQLGVVGVDVPELFGGAGGSLADLSVVAQEIGRTVAPLPYLSTAVLTVGALLGSADEDACRRWLPSLCDGTILGAVAAAADDGSWSCPPVDAVPGPSGWRLSGHASFVMGGEQADLLLIAARTAGALSLFAVSGDAEGLSREPMRTLDLTRRLAELRLNDVSAALVGVEGHARSVLEGARMRALAAIASEQLGGAERSLEMAVDYARQRIQFGRPIGSFQAIKHRCAEMALRIDEAESAVAWIRAASLDDGADIGLAVLAAASTCGDAFVFCSAESIQVHGGIGFTWEHPAHLYFRRARSDALLLGSPAEHREALFQRLGV